MKLTTAEITRRLAIATLAGCGLVATGCQPAPTPPGGTAATATAPAHDDHGHSHDHDAGDDHGHSHDQGHSHDDGAHALKATLEGGDAAAGRPVELVTTIRDESGKTITKFDVIHEHPVHLIAVRSGLDRFLHLHPTVDESGVATTPITFPLGGTWLLFADHSAAGHGEAVARTTLDIAGENPPAAPLVPNAPGKIAGEGPAGAPALSADVTVSPAANGREATIAFDLVGPDGAPATGVQKYLGAGGHLVVLSADGKSYAHAHPASDEPGARVEFRAHLPEPGIYKGWGQFKQTENVYTLPFVFEIKPNAS